MPGTSFHSTTRRAPSARASSVAVRSDPPRPSVVDAAVGRAADEAGHHRRSCRAASSGPQPRRARQAAGLGEVRRGAAVVAVGGDDLRGVDVRRAPARPASAPRRGSPPTCARRATPACRWRAARGGRARRWRRTARGTRARRASIVASSARRAGAGRAAAPRATSRCRRRNVAAARAPRRRFVPTSPPPRPRAAGR